MKRRGDIYNTLYIKTLLFDKNIWFGRTGVLLLTTFLSVMWFVADWCASTTYRAMSDWLLYTINISAAMILTLPWLLTRKAWIQIAWTAILDVAFLANIMYCRTYFTAIPPESYGMASNLSDFTASIWDSLRWLDLGFPLILTAGAVGAYITPVSSTRRRSLACVSLWTLILLVISFIGIKSRGGFYKEYDRLVQSCYYSTCGVPTYTIAGHLIYSELDKQSAQSPEQIAEVGPWLEEHRLIMPHRSLPDSVKRRSNLVLIICESLESWTLEGYAEGKEITPYLNSLISDSTTFYAPNVLTQVGPGRSIDAQLLIHSGMLPMVSSVYSMKYPSSTYPSLNKAMTELHEAESIIFTCDKPITWNQEAIARAFGYRELIDRRAWRMDEMIGNPAKLSDGSFLRQSVEKLESDSTLWPVGSNRMLTFVTYSGHSPFKLPERFADPDFDISGAGFPERLSDYITMAHYTDSQLHTLIDYIKSRPDYDSTLIVIVGDHEGLAASREDIINSSEKAKALVSGGQYTPMLILNSPVSGRYDQVMGQVDIYPTLLNLLGLDTYQWKGLGHTIFSPDKAPFAISTMTQQLAGDSTGISRQIIDHIYSAQRISDAIIRADLLSTPLHGHD